MENRFKFTKERLEALPPPESGRATYHDDGQVGLQLRVSASGVKTFNVYARVNGGRPERKTLGRFPNMSIEQARRAAKQVIAQLAEGKSVRAADKAHKAESLTLGDALKDYVEKKRRTKDGLPLKTRTKGDYLKMIAPGKERADGTFGVAGELHALAAKALREVTAEDIRRVYQKAEERGKRRAVYAMAVLRAVLNWHGVVVADNPLGKAAGRAGKDRIILAEAEGKPNPIPPEYLGAWWRAACAMDSVAADYLRFRLLTGTRGCEVLGDKHGNEPLRVRDVDIVGARIKLVNTKNRSDFTLLLSQQGLDIVKRCVEGKKPDELLFRVADPRKALYAINQAAGLDRLAHSGHDLRATFTSVADEMVSAYVLKSLINHTKSGDVTGRYVGKGEAQLRAGWQAVADRVEALAESNVVALHGAMT